MFIYNYLSLDAIKPPTAGLRRWPQNQRARPDKTVFTYRGDGDHSSIGMAEIMHCASQGENITTIFVNDRVRHDRRTQTSPPPGRAKPPPVPAGAAAEQRAHPHDRNHPPLTGGVATPNAWL